MAGVQTDLHTHFAGVLSPDELVQLGLQHDISLDTPTAKKLGVVSEDFSAKSIPLKELSNNQMSLLKAGLALDPSKQAFLMNWTMYMQIVLL